MDNVAVALDTIDPIVTVYKRLFNTSHQHHDVTKTFQWKNNLVKISVALIH